MSNPRFAAMRQRLIDIHTDCNTESEARLTDAFVRIVDLHQPTPGSAFCVVCSGDNSPASWPCPTVNVIRDAVIDTWGLGRERQ